MKKSWQVQEPCSLVTEHKLVKLFPLLGSSLLFIKTFLTPGFS